VLVSEQNKAILRRLVDDVMNAGRLEVLDEIYTPRMATAAKAWIASFRSSFPDVYMRVVDLVAEGRITRAWGLEDNLSRMRQLGYIDEHVSE
jgi:hypothetical protein